MPLGNGELLQWENSGAITAKLNSNFQASFHDVFFTTPDRRKSIQAHTSVYGRKVVSPRLGFNVKAGKTIIAQVRWSADDGFAFDAASSVGAGSKFKYYFLKQDGTMSGNAKELQFISYYGDTVVYLIPSKPDYIALNLGRTCYTKMLVKAGNDYQLITQDIGACARPSP